MDERADLAPSAQLTAAARARERARLDALFDDPWAGRLAGPAGFAWLDRPPLAAALWPVVRTRFLDDWLSDSDRPEATRQTVIVGAGLDARTFRLDWPAATRLYEIDRPEVLTCKAQDFAEAGATPRAARVPVGGDLLGLWDRSLVAGGLSARLPSL